MPLFRTLPQLVEAYQLGATDILLDTLARWCGGNLMVIKSPEGEVVSYTIEISTPEGVGVAQEGDWIIRGAKGEHYICKPDIFNQTYRMAV